MRHQFITAQLLWQAQAALDAEANESRGAGQLHRPSQPAWLGWGASTLLGFVALATVVSGLT
jgi:hypothetical protein